MNFDLMQIISEYLNNFIDFHYLSLMCKFIFYNIKIYDLYNIKNDKKNKIQQYILSQPRFLCLKKLDLSKNFYFINFVPFNYLFSCKFSILNGLKNV